MPRTACCDSFPITNNVGTASCKEERARMFARKLADEHKCSLNTGVFNGIFTPSPLSTTIRKTQLFVRKRAAAMTEASRHIYDLQ